ncbi:TPA: hypothetical protein ACGG77_002569, partial [Vibrio cholerae]
KMKQCHTPYGIQNSNNIVHKIINAHEKHENARCTCTEIILNIMPVKLMILILLGILKERD